MAHKFHTIVIPTRPQPDTIAAIFLLKFFGSEKYPGIKEAKIESRNTLPKGETPESMAERGYFLLDIGGGPFDHHAARGKVTASQLVANDLGISDNPTLSKLLQYAERDDKYGKGTISTDPIDRAFGLSGLVAAMNKSLPENPQRVVELILPLLLAHYKEEVRRTEELPKEFEQHLSEGKAEVFEIKYRDKKMKAVIVVSSSASLAGWLRSQEGLKADIVAQFLDSGHLNILTRPAKRIDLRMLAAVVRTREAMLRKRDIEASLSYLMRPGRIPEVPEWYYDRATNSLQNGGVNPGATSQTAISRGELKEIIELAFSDQAFAEFGEGPPAKEAGALPREQGFMEAAPRQYFLEIRIPQEAGREIAGLLEDVSPGVKLHRPENFHITLMHFGERSHEEVEPLIHEVERALEGISSFTLVFHPDDFMSGPITGYEEGRAFYFAISDERGGEALVQIRKSLEQNVSNFKEQIFIPHLTVASTKSDVMEEVARDAAVEVNSLKQVEVFIKKLRLTEVIKTLDGRILYRARHYFPLGETHRSPTFQE